MEPCGGCSSCVGGVMGAGVLLWAPNDTVLLKFKARDKQYNDAGSRVTAACKKKAEKLGKDEALLAFATPKAKSVASPKTKLVLPPAKPLTLFKDWEFIDIPTQDSRHQYRVYVVPATSRGKVLDQALPDGIVAFPVAQFREALEENSHLLPETARSVAGKRASLGRGKRALRFAIQKGLLGGDDKDEEEEEEEEKEKEEKETVKQEVTAEVTAEV